jgi:4-amino-4-deoxy-L-arabinose transferase-like glycosyltransferase
VRVADDTSVTSTPSATPPATSRALTISIAALAVAGVVLRIWALNSPLGRLDSDEAVVGLMADAFRHGHFTTYYWGQSYGGTLEPALVALLFLFTGTSTLALKLVPILLRAVACLLVWRVGRRTVGEPAARFAGALFWVFPPAFVWGSTKERGFYEVALVLALLVVLFAVRLEQAATAGRPLERVDLLAFGFCAGLAVWTSPQTIYVLAPVVLWLAYRARERWREAWPIIPAAMVGGLPFLVYAARHGKSAFYQSEVASSYASRLKNFFTDMLGRAFGGKIPITPDWLGGAIGKTLFLGLLTAFVVALVMRVRADGSRRRQLEPLVVTAVAYPFLATFPRLSTFTDEPRYVLLLAPIVVLLLSYVLTTDVVRVLVSAGAILLAIVFIASMLSWVDRRPQSEDIAPPTLAPIERLLARQHVDHVYADYWIAYRLMFGTDGDVVASPVLSVRRRAFAQEVAGRPATPFVVYRGDVYDRRLGPALRGAGVRSRRLTAGEYALYLPDRAVDPAQFERIWLLDP